MNNLNKNLLFLIKSFETTQSELAAFAGVSQNSISNWINEVSYPNAPVLVKIHQFFGVSIDALLLLDIEKSGILTSNHIKEFKRIRKVNKNVPGKVPPVSKEYLIPDNPGSLQLGEQDMTANWSVAGQLKKIQEKLDKVQDSLDAIAKK